ncbi:MerR family transcriptional regulator [Vagococcus sp. BWB3-3]|uniref:MerR family transcriptional regulator n=1 Tax=Vagococcus allomyrinae TaxID=2794353 RepID=A0A940P9W2_9ENTE|nr:MerR family transcriptional regulator [Vagococcus allomyrinae]MBP1040637.1 MerR family transcriptional regulator [Vagococcus allomyrinae]
MLTIGEFSKACGVTVKTLRHYDKIGLLLPSKVDNLTNYRYYSANQMSQMLLINRLKRYGLSLQRIQELMSTEELLIPALVNQKHVLAKDINQIQAAINELDAHLKSIERTGKIMDYQKNYEIRLVEREPLPIISVRQQMGISQFDQAFGKLFEKIGKLQAFPTGPAMALYHDSEFAEEDTDIEVAIPVKDHTQATRVLSGGPHLVTVHRGAYNNLSEAYAAIVEFMAGNHYQSKQAPFEIYVESAMTNKPVSEWETSVYFPVEKMKTI